MKKSRSKKAKVLERSDRMSEEYRAKKSRSRKAKHTRNIEQDERRMGRWKSGRGNTKNRKDRTGGVKNKGLKRVEVGRQSEQEIPDRRGKRLGGRVAAGRQRRRKRAK